MNKDKFIAEKLGLCWHEMMDGSTSNDKRPEAILIHCSCGARLNPIEWPGHERRNNPDFTSEAGRVKLLKLMFNGENWGAFALYLLARYGIEISGVTSLFVPVGYIADDNGKFRDAVYKWLGGEE